jgi:hypothetical protein
VRLQTDDLSPDDVSKVVSRHAATTPLTATDIRDYCRLLRDTCEHVSTTRVSYLLGWLHDHGRVTRIDGTERDQLGQLGVEQPQPKRVYWMLTANTKATE